MSTAKNVLPLGALQRALEKIKPAIPGPKCLYPALRCIRVEPVNSGVRLEAQDIDLSISVEVPAEWGLIDPIGLNAEKLNTYVSRLKGEKISVSTTAINASLSCGKARASIRLISGANLPAREPVTSEGKAISIPQNQFLRMITHVQSAISDDESRYTLSGAMLEKENGRLNLVATDSHRLSLYSVPYGGDDFQPILLPRDFIKACASTLIEDDEPLHIYSAENYILAKVSQEFPVSIFSHKISGRFPDYRLVMPKSNEITFTADPGVLLESLSRSTIFVDEKTHCTRLEIAHNTLRIFTTNAELGDAHEEIEIDGGSEEELKIGFNSKYVIDSVKHIKGAVTFHLKDSATAALITYEPVEGEICKHIVMPMRLQ